MFLLHVAQALWGQVPRPDSWGGGGRAPGPLWVGSSGPRPVLMISLGQGGHFIAGWDLVLKKKKTRFDIPNQTSFTSKNPIC